MIEKYRQIIANQREEIRNLHRKLGNIVYEYGQRVGYNNGWGFVTSSNAVNTRVFFPYDGKAFSVSTKELKPLEPLTYFSKEIKFNNGRYTILDRELSSMGLLFLLMYYEMNDTLKEFKGARYV